MVDSISAIQTTPLDTPAMQFARASHAAFISEIVQAEIENNVSAIDAPFFVNQGLLEFNAPTLALFNETVGADPASATITGDLTAEQLQEIAILRQDIAGLEEAANASNHIPLTTAASTLDLSLEAQAIADGSTIVPTVNNPTPLQLEQLGAIFAPVANAPLTSPVLLQIQAQLTPAGLSPQLLSLNSIFLAQNYLSGVRKASNLESDNKEKVAAISAIDRVAVEDSAILA